LGILNNLGAIYKLWALNNWILINGGTHGHSKGKFTK